MLITILNIYNPHNNIKFTKEKRKWKKLPVLDFLKIKYHTKRKGKKKKDKSLRNPHSKH